MVWKNPVIEKLLVMELAEGETLAARIGRGPLPMDDALAIAHQIAEALEAAHERGVMHRDVKPSNVKVNATGQVKVLDFGLEPPEQVPHNCSRPIRTSASKNKLFKRHAARIRRPFVGFCGLWRRHIMRFILTWGESCPGLPLLFRRRAWDSCLKTVAVVRVDVSSRAVARTASGTRVGDTEEKIKAIYPGQIRVEPHHYDPENGHYLIFVPKDQSDRSYEIVFETDGKQVTQFRVGFSSATALVEGCS